MGFGNTGFGHTPYGGDESIDFSLTASLVNQSTLTATITIGKPLSVNLTNQSFMEADIQVASTLSASFSNQSQVTAYILMIEPPLEKKPIRRNFEREVQEIAPNYTIRRRD